MKLKKIISVIAAISMLSTVFVANTFAAATAENPTVVKLTYTEKDITEDEDFGDYAEEYDAYSIKIAVDNYPFAFVKNTGGYILTGYNVKFDVTGSAKAGEGEDWWIAGKGQFVPETTNYGRVANPISTTSRTEGQNSVALETVTLLVKQGVSIKLVPSDSELGFAMSSYATGSLETDASDAQKVNISNGLLAFDEETAAGFQIGTPAPAAKLDRVVISGETTGLKMGEKETTTLTATAYNDDDTVNEAATITWSVDGDAVKVDNGVVTAVKAGTATVTAKAVDGGIEKTASVEITVAEADPIVVTPSIKVLGPNGEEANITAAPGTAVTGSVGGKEVKGFVWPLVKLINFNAAGTYRATFTADDSETAERTFDFSGIETVGKTDIEFAIVLNANKTAVNLNMQYVAPSAE